MLTEIILYSGLGALVGFLAGLLGVGGGGILVPTLTVIFIHRGIGDTQYLTFAIATSLACMLPTTCTSAFSHHKRQAVAWDVVKHLAIGSIFGALIGAKLAINIPPTFTALFFVAFMILTALQLFANWQPKQNQQPLTIMSMYIAGILVGLISALISLGGAFLIILFLTYNGIDFKKAIGTSSAVSFLSVMFATISYLLFSNHSDVSTPYSFGFIYLPAFLTITLMSLIFTPIGVNTSHNLPNKILKRILGIICVLLSLKMLWSTFIH